MNQDVQRPKVIGLHPCPMLAEVPHVLQGYLTLEHEEQHYREIACHRQAPMIRVWLRLLSLYVQAVIHQRNNPATIAEGDYALQLKLQMLAMALGSAKPALDAILGGYYVQALMLIRHMLESWVVVVYAIARPDQAHRWYDERPCDYANKPPDDTKMHAAIRESSSTKNRVPVLNNVIDDIKRLNKHAHPTEQTLNQTVPHAGGAIKSGANYSEIMARQAFHDGAHAMRILLRELAEVVPQFESWQSEMTATIEEHCRVMQTLTTD